ncbi:MAG: ArnT family glycosyltransferase [Gemmatimonadota bacterium]
MAVSLLALATGLGFQGSRGLYETTEGRYAEVAREMVATADYLTPRLDAEAHWTKPPLAYWAIAGGLRLRADEWGARLSGALAFFLTVLAVATIGGTLWGEATGIAAGLVYATSLFPVAAANTVNADTLLTLWEVAAVLCYVRAVWRPGDRQVPARRWILAMWAAFGLGFLTKGPPALLPLLAVVVWNRRRARLFHPAGLLLFLLIGLGWYGVQSSRHPELLPYLVGQEVIARNLTSTFHRSPQWWKPFTLYVPLLALGGGLWSYWSWRAALGRRLYRPSVLWRRFRGDGPGAFLLAWLLLPLVVFFLSRSRMPLYVLPLYAPVALATGRTLAPPGTRAARRWVWTLGLLTATGLAVLKSVAAGREDYRDMRRLSEQVRSVAGPPREPSVDEGAAGLRVYAYEQEKLFGLEYYLGGRIRRVSASGAEPWADASLQSALREIHAAHETAAREADAHKAREADAHEAHEAGDPRGIGPGEAAERGRGDAARADTTRLPPAVLLSRSSDGDALRSAAAAAGLSLRCAERATWVACGVRPADRPAGSRSFRHGSTRRTRRSLRPPPPIGPGATRRGSSTRF